MATEHPESAPQSSLITINILPDVPYSGKPEFFSFTFDAKVIKQIIPSPFRNKELMEERYPDQLVTIHRLASLPDEVWLTGSRIITHDNDSLYSDESVQVVEGKRQAAIFHQSKGTQPGL